MDSLRLDRLASHVVTWHNSHRWARRITEAHVTSVGYVVLPFAPTPSSSPAAALAAVAALPPVPASEPAPDSPPAVAIGPLAGTAPAPASAPAVPAAAAEIDEPIEVLIDAPDIDLATVRDLAPEESGAEPLAQGTDEAAVSPSDEAAADAPVDIAFDETLSPAAAAAADPLAQPSEAPAETEDSTPAPPASTADPGAGATLRERAMARAQQMTQEATLADAAAYAPATQASPEGTADGAPAAVPGAVPAAAPVAALADSAQQPTTTAPAAPLAAARLTPIFSEDFIPPLRPADIAEFAHRHGASYASPGKDGLVRVVKPDPGMVYPVVEQRWLLTAQVDIGGQRTRLLVGAGPEPQVMGARLSRLPRLAMLGGPPLVVAAAASLWWLWPAAPSAPAKSSAPAPALGAASAAHTASAAMAASAASAAAAGMAASAAAATSPATDTLPAAQPSASAPADVEPTLGRVELPSLGPIVDERRRAAAAAAEARAASAASATVEPAQQPVPPPAVSGPAFAVSTRLLRTRTESEQLAEAMRALLVGSAAPGLQVQALRSGEDWRVVVWPFTEHAQAEKARALLAARGMKVSVIDF